MVKRNSVFLLPNDPVLKGKLPIRDGFFATLPIVLCSSEGRGGSPRALWAPSGPETHRPPWASAALFEWGSG